MKSVLEIDSVYLEYGLHKVLQNVYLKSETDCVTGLLGRNGSGKSCLLQCIFGEIIPTNVSVRINHKVLTGSYRSPNDLRYLPQNTFIPGSFYIKRVFKDFELDFADFTSVFPELEQFARSRLRHLSGGQRRLVEIYTVLMSQSRFCMLDEPFSHIMPIHVDAIKELIIREKKNKGILITDHMYRHIIDLSDQLYVIKDGKTYLTKSIEDIEILGYANIQ